MARAGRSKSRRRNAPRRNLFRDVRHVLQHEASSSLVPATFLAMAVLDAIPVPTDVGYFYVQRWLDEHRNEMSTRKRKVLTYVNYYGWDVTWYGGLGLLTYFLGHSVKEKLVLGAGVLSTGVLATLWWKSQHPNATLPSPEVERFINEGEAEGMPLEPGVPIA